MAWRVRFARGDERFERGGRGGTPDRGLQAVRDARPGSRGGRPACSPGGAAALTGSAYDGCITPRLAQRGPPVYRYYAWRPAPSLQPGWLFAGTGVTRVERDRGNRGLRARRARAGEPGRARACWAAGTDASCMPELSPRRSAGRRRRARSTRRARARWCSRRGRWAGSTGSSRCRRPRRTCRAAPDARVVAMTRNLLAARAGRLARRERVEAGEPVR